MKLIVLLVGAIVSGILYRMGGSDKWDTKWRDLGVPFIMYTLLSILLIPHKLSYWLLLIPTFGLTFGALTTYYDSVFGYDNYWVHGFMVGLAAFPLAWAGIHWYMILIRAILLGALVGGWSAYEKNAVREEFGRGFLMAITIPLLIL